MFLRSLLLPVLVLAVATTSIVPNASAETVAAEPCSDPPAVKVTTSAVFNNPAAGDPTAVVSYLCSLINQAPAGSLLQMSEFVISGEAGLDFANAVIAAHRRGVRIHLVMDGWQVDNPAVDAIKEELGTDESAPSWLHVCSHLSPEGSTSACIGDKGNHNKFLLFSSTGGASNVVVQASNNLTDLNSTTYWNNAVTFVGNQRLYAAYGSYFADLVAEEQDPDYYRVVSTGTPGGAVRAHFFPRAGTDATTDTIVEILSKVSCRGGDTKIRIGMSEWEAYRIAIADRIRELAADGCEVEIVNGKMDAEVRERLDGVPGVDVRTLGSARELPGYIHSKYMLIEGRFDGENDAHWVFTGSPNFTQTSLRRNDEAMVATNIEKIYQQYVSNFGTAQAAAS